MVRLLYIAIAMTMLVGAAEVQANGRPPASRSVTVSGDRIAVGVTFGLLVSSDNGASFRWVCEAAVGYGGTFDPDYAMASDGALFATTFAGLRVSRDGGCSWELIGGALQDHWIGEVEIGSDGRVWALTATGGQANDVFVSADGEAAFASVGMVDDTTWWQSLRVAPSDPMRIYLTGFRIDPALGTQARLFRSNDGGDSFQELSTADFVFGVQSQLAVMGVSQLDPDVVFARVVGVNGPQGDALYKSSNSGDSWTKVLDSVDELEGFVVRASGDVIAGTATDGIFLSHDGGDNFTRYTQPQLTCVAEDGDGTLVGCGSNWEPDLFALGRSADGVRWDKVLQFSDIVGPLSCPGGTVQRDMCEAEIWPNLASQFGVGGASDGNGGRDGDAPDGLAPSGPGGCGSCAIVVLFVLPWASRRRPAD